MTKQIIYILIIFTSLTMQVSGQTLYEILKKHYKAVGMKYLKNVHTIQYKGYYVNHFLKKISNNVSESTMKPDFELNHRIKNHKNKSK